MRLCPAVTSITGVSIQAVPALGAWARTLEELQLITGGRDSPSCTAPGLIAPASAALAALTRLRQLAWAHGITHAPDAGLAAVEVLHNALPCATALTSLAVRIAAQKDGNQLAELACGTLNRCPGLVELELCMRHVALDGVLLASVTKLTLSCVRNRGA